MAGNRTRGASVWTYLKHAFTWKWNLLALAGAAGLALLGPSPDIVLPLIGAAELIYLAGLTGIPRFRAAIDAKEHARGASRKGVSAGNTRSPETRLGDMLVGLNPDASIRFFRLRNRCIEMRGIAQGVRGRQGRSEADDLQTPALDRLLWVFLRLLYSDQALAKFLTSTDADAIRAALEELKRKRTAAEEKADERLLRSLNDSIATAELRLDNYDKAEGNSEFVEVELDRIEGKIQALTEMAVSHQDPDYISNQVDSVAASMQHTEEAINELQHITGLEEEMEGPPSILEAELESVGG